MTGGHSTPPYCWGPPRAPSTNILANNNLRDHKLAPPDHPHLADVANPDGAALVRQPHLLPPDPLPPLGRDPGPRGQLLESGEQAQSLRFNCRTAYNSPDLTDDETELGTAALPTSSQTLDLQSRLGHGVHQLVQVFAALPECSDDEPDQVSEGLEPPLQRPDLVPRDTKDMMVDVGDLPSILPGEEPRPPVLGPPSKVCYTIYHIWLKVIWPYSYSQFSPQKNSLLYAPFLAAMSSSISCHPN